MNLEEMKKRVEELEAQWRIYHKSPRNNKMPDMTELTKLRIEIERKEREK